MSLIRMSMEKELVFGYNLARVQAQKKHTALLNCIAIDLFKTLYTSVKEKDFIEKSCISDSTCRVACCCQSTIEKGQLLFYDAMFFFHVFKMFLSSIQQSVHCTSVLCVNSPLYVR